MPIYSIYLSTLSTANVIDKSNLANTTFSINWKALFNETYGMIPKKRTAKLRIQMVTRSSTNINAWDNYIGSLRLNFSSPYSISNNGLCVAQIQPMNDNITAANHALQCDTTNNHGITILLPDDNQNLNVRFFSVADVLMTNVPEYQITLYFDVDD